MSVDTVPATSVKITCSRDELARVLGLVGRAVSTRGAVQILGGLLLASENGSLRVAATDMEMSLRGEAVAELDGDGSVVVPGRLLLDIVRLLPSGEVTLEHEADSSTLHIACGSASYRVNTYRAEDYPRLPEVNPESLVTVSRQALLETIARVSRAASRDESRPVLTGILMRLEGPTLIMAATDSYRLAVKETRLEESVNRELEAIVPARALGELARIGQASNAEGISIGVQENQVVFVVDGIVLTARLIDGQFPNFRQLKPEGFEAEVRLSREEILDAVKRVGVMAQRNAPLRMRFESGELTIQAQAQDVGEASESLPISYSGDALEIGFNPDFLREGFESISEPEVRVKLITPLRPGLITGEGDDFWYLIMPIRLAG
jgi:DNA polymerase-3 subunit beta